MRPSRWLPLLLVLLLAACGGSSAASDDGNGNGGESQAAETPEPAESEGNGGNGGNGGDPGDLDALVDALTPPNANETSRTTVEGAVFVSWETPDSPESLEGFYENAISNAGLEVFSRTSAQGTFSWIFGFEDGSEEGGVVSVAPSPSGSGSAVVVQVGSGG